MNSPITGKAMHVQREPRVLIFRKETFTIQFHYYLCEDSGERFTDGVLDELNIAQVHNQYREKYNLPFTETIIGIRKKYEISAAKMSEILGFGTNIYRAYEAGEVPNLSNSKLIALAENPREFRELVLVSNELTDKEKDKIYTRIDYLTRGEEEKKSERYIEKYLVGSFQADIYTGYQRPNLRKFFEMVAFFAKRLQPYKTRLNKLLFYTDFLHFCETSFSISGMRYQAIPLGPVPKNFDSLFEFAEKMNTVKIVYEEFGDGNFGQRFEHKLEHVFQESIFDKRELSVLERVIETYGSLETQELIKRSHSENGWLINIDEKNLIRYSEAFNLKSWE